MGSIIKVNEYKDFNNNDIMTSDGAGVVTPNASGIKNVPAFAAYLGANQTVADATETKITVDTEVFDSDGAFSSNKFTVPSGQAGKYLINLSGKSDLAIDTYAYIFTAVNGTKVERSTQGSVKPNATGNVILNSAVIVDLAVSDYVELFIWQNSGSDQLAYADYCSLSGYKLGV